MQYRQDVAYSRILICTFYYTFLKEKACALAVISIATNEVSNEYSKFKQAVPRSIFW